jgi:hypothetical protein
VSRKAEPELAERTHPAAAAVPSPTGRGHSRPPLACPPASGGIFR